VNINKTTKIALAVVLCLAMILPFIPVKYSPVAVEAGAAEVNFATSNIGTGFKGKKISILGDSISTYEGVSNDKSANSTIANNAVYYTENNDYGIVRKDTWWQQAIDMLDMQLCVNNSWSGSSVMGTNSSDNYTAAWVSRCQQLHNASSGNPDIIAVYMGTNDIKNATSGFDTFADNKNTMLTEAAGTSTSVKKFSLYIRMVSKMMTRYPNAQIYLFTLLPNESQNDIQVRAMEQYNQSIRDLVTYYQGQSKKVYLVDLYNDTSITRDFEVLKKHLANTLHPNDAGMDAITNCFVSSLVHNSEWAQNPANWKTVEYDLTDVYVSGGQINTLRMSSSTDVPFFVSLMPTRSEYGLDVSVKAHKVGKAEADTADNWDDITAQCYSGGTVYIKRLHYGTYDKVKIIAKAVYDTKNFRWELSNDKKVFGTCTADGTDYNIIGELTSDDINLENGSLSNGSFVDAQYSLSDSILLRNEVPWVVEWKASGAFTKDILLFSGSDTSKTRSNSFLFSDNGRYMYIGYYNGYRSQFWNYGVTIPDSVVLNASTSHVYRLTNVVSSDGSNMVYLFVDNEEIGPMNNYAIGTTAQTGDLATQNWLSGRDLEFSFMGAYDSAKHYLNDCSIEYIQVWEGGEFDTLRLQQLIQEYDELSVSMKDANGFTAYKSAVDAAKAYVNGLKDQTNNQAKVDALVADIMDARNELTSSANSTQIYSVELLTRNYVAIGKPTGLKIVTSPDVERIQIGDSNYKPLTNSSSLQTIKIDGVDTEVKVWLISFLRSDSTEKIVQYRFHALKDADVVADKDNYGDATVLVNIPYGSNCYSDLRVTATPDKLYYVVGETLDTTGMEVTAYYGDGTTSKVITNYTVKYQNGNAFSAGDTYATISYKDYEGTITTTVPVNVVYSVSNIDATLVDQELTVQGYYVGVAQEGYTGDNEIVLKDLYTDDLVMVRDVIGDFPNNGFKTGDLVRLTGTVRKDGTSDTPNKLYISYAESNGFHMNTVVSRDNNVSFALDNVVTVTSWNQLTAAIADGSIGQGTYVRFSGNIFISTYSGDDSVISYRVHMNADATADADIKAADATGTRSVAIRANVLNRNLSTDPLSAIVDSNIAYKQIPGDSFEGSLIAVYTGANNTYYSFTVFDADWIDLQG